LKPFRHFGTNPWTGDRPIEKPQQRSTERRGHTSTPRVGFESRISVFERLKTIRTLDNAATGMGEKKY